MVKRVISLLLSVLIIMGNFACVMAEDAEKVMVVDTASLSTAKESGLILSSTFTRDSKFSLCWSDMDLNRAIKLPCKSDWSTGKYLEFWAYSTVQTGSSFGLALISDNSDTRCIDYYDAVIEVDFKGWKLISLALDEFSAVHTPMGFNSIDRIELWPVYGEYSMNSSVDLYFDSFYITSKRSEVTTEEESDFVLFDLSTMAGIDASNWSSGAPRDKVVNVASVKAPEKDGYAMRFTDTRRTGKQYPDGLNFEQLPTPDFSKYNTLEISIYSDSQSYNNIRVSMWADDPNRASNDYYYCDFQIDWAGEWKNVQIRLDSISAGGVPLGWDQIQKISFGMGEPSEDAPSTVLYMDKITLKNVDYNLLWSEPQYLEPAPEVENQFDFTARIKERFPNNEHPRLLMTQSDIDWIKENYNNDEYLSKVVPKFLDTCNNYVQLVSSPSDPRTAGEHTAHLALAYLITGNQSYADSIWKKMKVLTTETTTWNPNSQSHLWIGDTSRWVAVTYDLMYNSWTEEQRRIVRNAMVLYALKPFRGNLISHNGAGTQENNWNPVINSGVGMAALAIADEEGYADTVNQYLNRIHIAIRNCFKHYGPSGVGHEGPDYWNYTMQGYLPYENALYNSIGDEDYPRFSVLDEYGMEKTGDYIIQMHGTFGASFNYYDGSPRGCYSWGDFWLARYFNRPELAGMEYEATIGTLYNILMYRPNSEYKNWRNNMPLDYQGHGEAQVGAMRTDFDKQSQGFYVGYKGNGQNTASHAKLDAGAFVLDALGIRWIDLLPSESYSLPNIFGPWRYKYYRNRAEGSNTLVINPGVAQGSNHEDDYQATEDILIDQVNYSDAPIETANSEPWASYAVVNLTGAYSETADVAKRGYALIDGRNAFLLQDEIKVKSPCDVYSFMHTPADIEVAEDGKSAILSRNSKKMKATLLSNCDATLLAMDAELLETSPQVEHTPNTGYRKLAVKARVSGQGTISVLFTPYYGEDSYSFTMDSIVPLSQWNTFLAEPVALTGLYLDGVALEDFSDSKTVYSLKEDRVGEITATAANGIKLNIEQAKKVGDTALVKATNDDDVTTTYAITFTNDAQKRLDNWSSYAPKEIICSENPDPTAISYTMDGDLTTMWTVANSAWMMFDLGAVKPVHEVQLYWRDQPTRVETFDIQLSDDAENWRTVWSGESLQSGKLEGYSFEPTTARYVKVTGHYNTKNAYTSLCEMYVSYSGTNFDDLGNHWAQPVIEEMGKVGIVEGTAYRVYSPEATLSRAAYLTMLSRAYGLTAGEYSGMISDVSKNDWFMPYVEAAYSRNLIPAEMLKNGFKPNKSITREEICALSVSFYEKFVGTVKGTTLDKFTDKNQISSWAVPYVQKGLALRLIAGITDDRFAPNANATRAQAATILKRIYIKIS